MSGRPTDAIPDAAPVNFDSTSDFVLGGEATVPQREYGPPIPSRFPTPHSVGSEIRELERRVRARLTPLLPPGPPRKLPFQFLWSRYRQLAMRHRSAVIDDYGRDPAFVNRLAPYLELLFSRYFRASVKGLSNVPEQGGAILVVNHSGALPYDTLLLTHLIRTRLGQKRQLRALIEDFLFHAPYVGVVLNRLGAVRACPENAQRLLSDGNLVAVFPEGIKGPSKLYKDRYKLQRFGRGGFVKLALRAGVPIIPVAIVGAEETHPVLGRMTRLTRTLGLEYLPVTPTFPWLGPLGLLPLPSKWSVSFGEPIRLSD
ncbi:MAG: acyltransferase family protein, partial [Deltaproteobacteria bacterium]|nr:acyltransferase family protein [Deltaproteobacteria bacterium]